MMDYYLICIWVIGKWSAVNINITQYNSQFLSLYKNQNNLLRQTFYRFKKQPVQDTNLTPKECDAYMYTRFKDWDMHTVSTCMYSND